MREHKPPEGGRPLLIVFAKKPTPGKVQTRLARDIGNEKAAAVYGTLAEGVWRETCSEAYDRWVAFTPQDDGAFMERWLSGAARYLPQAAWG